MAQSTERMSDLHWPQRAGWSENAWPMKHRSTLWNALVVLANGFFHAFSAKAEVGVLECWPVASV